MNQKIKSYKCNLNRFYLTNCVYFIQRPQILILSIFTLILVQILAGLVFLFSSESQNNEKCRSAGKVQAYRRPRSLSAPSVGVRLPTGCSLPRPTGWLQQSSYADSESPRNSKLYSLVFVFSSTETCNLIQNRISWRMFEIISGIWRLVRIVTFPHCVYVLISEL